MMSNKTNNPQITRAVVEIPAGVERGPDSVEPEFSTVTSKRCMPLDVMWVSSTFAWPCAATVDLEAERPMLI